jgi:hypothetical protein
MSADAMRQILFLWYAAKANGTTLTPQEQGLMAFYERQVARLQPPSMEAPPQPVSGRRVKLD